MAEQLTLVALRSERERRITWYRDNRPEYLGFVRAIARDICRRDGTVDVDKVHEEMESRDLPLPDELFGDGRIFGALFCKREFVAIGRHITTRTERVARAGSGSSWICVYRLREAA